MNDKQIELYHKNLVTLLYAFNEAGGQPIGLLIDQRKFLEVLARNGISVNPRYDKIIGDN